METPPGTAKPLGRSRMKHPTNPQEEEWRLVPGLMGRYSVSSHGQVRREEFVARNNKRWLAQIVPYRLNTNGYLRVECVGRRRYVHRLVALAFLGSCPNGMQVNHIDGNRQNNRADNLEYVTPGDNTRHGESLRRALGVRAKPGPKLTPAQVLDIRRRRTEGARQVDLAVEYGVSPSMVSKVVHRHHWGFV